MVTATVAAAIFAGVGTAVSVVGAIRSGNAAKAQADFQSKIADQEATRKRQEAAAKEKDFRRQTSRQRAAVRAARGASGTASGTGSNLLTDEDFLAESEVSALRIRQGGEIEAQRLGQEADLFTFQGKSAQTASRFRAGSSLLGGASKTSSFFI